MTSYFGLVWVTSLDPRYQNVAENSNVKNAIEIVRKKLCLQNGDFKTVPRDPEATYVCFFNETHKRIDMSIVEGTGEPEILKVIGNLGGSVCNITNNASRFSINITPGSPMCGVTNGTSNNPAGKGYQLTAITSLTVGAITVTDSKYVIDCEFNVINTEITISTQAMNVSDGVVVTRTAVVESETVNLKIVDAAKGNTVYAVKFGQRIKLQAVLYTRKIEGAATGITIHDCVAVNDLAAPTTTVNMIGADGCMAPGLVLYPVTSDNHGFYVANKTDYFVKTESPVFKAFIRNDGTAVITFRCNATFCYQDNSRCNTSCTQSQRKKRETDVMNDTPQTMKIEATLTVGMSHLAVPKNDKQDTGVKTELKKEVAACVPTVNVAGMAILGAILVLTVIVAVGFFVVIMRSRNAAASAKNVVS